MKYSYAPLLITTSNAPKDILISLLYLLQVNLNDGVVAFFNYSQEHDYISILELRSKIVEIVESAENDEDKIPEALTLIETTELLKDNKYHKDFSECIAIFLEHYPQYHINKPTLK